MLNFRFIAFVVIFAVGGWFLWQVKPWHPSAVVATAQRQAAPPEAAAPPPPAEEAPAPLPPSPQTGGAIPEGGGGTSGSVYGPQASMPGTAGGESREAQQKAEAESLSRAQAERANEEAAKAAAEAPPKPRMVDILFGTDRAPTGRPAGGGFDSERGEKLTLGEAKISIPPNHTPGVIERPITVFTIKLQSEDPNRHFVIAEPPKIFSSEAEFLKAIPPSNGRALLFVHGYNTSFEDGLYRAAQITYDLNFDGPSFFYSWASKGNFFDYAADNQSVENTLVQGYFKHFVQLIAERAKVKNITVIAHSKGNDLVLRTLAELSQSEHAKITGHISHLVLASPDVDRDVARALISQVVPIAGDVTLYANAKDIPLIVSACIGSGLLNCDVPRAGALLADGTPLVVLPADSIDASAARFDLLGFNHNAYVYDDFLRGDLLKLVMGERPPDIRSVLLKRHLNQQNAVYWRYEHGG